MILVFLGPPGSGKGTQADILQREYDYLKVSTGDLIRDEIRAGTPLGKSVQEIVESGAFPSDDLVMNMVSEKLRSGHEAGYILDGFPRTLSQAEALDRFLLEKTDKVDAVFKFCVGDGDGLKRIITRYNCAQCGHIYNHDVRPKILGVCDVCGSRQFQQRKDDCDKTFKKRLDVYHEKTQPVADYYHQKGICHEIDATPSVEKVTEQLHRVLKALLQVKLFEQKV